MIITKAKVRFKNIIIEKKDRRNEQLIIISITYTYALVQIKIAMIPLAGIVVVEL